MEGKMKIISVSILIIMLLSTFSCDENDNIISANGTIYHYNLEGGFFGIVTDKGDHFLPENLNEEYRKNSLRVHFEGIITDKVTIQMWGRTVDITKIQKIQ
jgi:hypothetical protein